MEQSDYVKAGSEKMGSLAALARHLNQSEGALRNARKHIQGLPVYACVSLAKLLNVPPMEIIAASELVTAKTEERRALFLPFVQGVKHAHFSSIVTTLCGVVFALQAGFEKLNQLALLSP